MSKHKKKSAKKVTEPVVTEPVTTNTSAYDELHDLGSAYPVSVQPAKPIKLSVSVEHEDFQINATSKDPRLLRLVTEVVEEMTSDPLGIVGRFSIRSMPFGLSRQLDQDERFQDYYVGVFAN